ADRGARERGRPRGGAEAVTAPLALVYARPAEPLHVAAAALVLEPAFLRRRRGRGRDATSGHAQRLAERCDEPLGRELAVAQLAPFVLRDRAQNRPGLRDDTALLHVRQRGRRLDVEHRLDPRLRLLRVL